MPRNKGIHTTHDEQHMRNITKKQTASAPLDDVSTQNVWRNSRCAGKKLLDKMIGLF